LIILDESFAALDPENLRRCLHFALQGLVCWSSPIHRSNERCGGKARSHAQRARPRQDLNQARELRAEEVTAARDLTGEHDPEPVKR